MNFTGINLYKYELSLCKRCLGCQRMEQDDFVPQTKCGQAVLVEGAQTEVRRQNEEYAKRQRS
jgi:hypothetical protein